MPLPTAPLLGFLADNLRKRASVMPLWSKRVTKWAAGLGLPTGGETVLYTGHMYQMIPTLAKVAGMTSRFEDHWLGKYLAIGRVANKVVNVSLFLPRPNSRDQKRYEKYLRNIVRLLRAADIGPFGYLYEAELYTGALVRDLGVDDLFERHARKVFKRLQKHGVKRAITVDPHTTDMLRNVYPSVVPEYDVEVKSYLELLRERALEPQVDMDSTVVVHDSCVYARYLDVVEEPRNLLEKVGFTINEPEYSGKTTFCCGGPVESLFPSKAHEIARKRMEQLTANGNDVVTMCPICLFNLAGAANGQGTKVEDISEYLIRAYGVEKGNASWEPK